MSSNCFDWKWEVFKSDSSGWLSKRDQFEVIKLRNLPKIGAWHYTKKNWSLQEELMPCKERNIINDPLVNRQNTLPTAALQARLNQEVRLWTRMVTASLTCARLFQDWPWRSWKLASWMVLRFSSSSETQSLKTQWSGTRSMETMQNLSTTCWLLSETWAAIWASRCTTYFHTWTRLPENLGSMRDDQGQRFHQDLKEMETRYQGCWDAVIMADYCWNLKRPPCCWAFQEFEETVQALKFEQWWSNMQFMCTYLYQCPPFSLQ